MVGLVVGYDLVDPGAELTNPSVYGRLAYIAIAGAPRDNANKHPRVPLLADEGASGVSLKKGEEKSHRGDQRVPQGSAEDRTGCRCSPGRRKPLRRLHRSWNQ